jgi:hypothetical protein
MNDIDPAFNPAGKSRQISASHWLAQDVARLPRQTFPIV